MLEDKEQVFEVGKVVAFRILTGDEIIGEITSMDKESITIKKPCGLQIQPHKPVAYQRSAIVARMTPRVDAVESYEEWASDIALIKKDGLVLPK
jgi:hypothetical protein